MNRRRVLGAVLVFLGLPPLVALYEAASFHVRNRNNGSIVSSGEKREYLLYVPESYDATRPTPLVVSLHGGANWPAIQRDLSGWNRLAERHGFLVVYPAGLEVAGLRAWRVWGVPGLEKDVRFISDLVDDLAKTYNVDTGKVYANGLSNGGAMAFVLSCRLADRIAAIGVVGAAQILPWSWCKEIRPMPMISFHGTADEAVPYEGGTSWASPNRAFPDVLEWTAGWARRNRCGPEPALSEVADDVTRLEYPDCANGAAIVLYTIHGGGHTWPGGGPLPEWFVGPTSHSVDATDRMWSFFEENGPSRTSHDETGENPEYDPLQGR